MRSDNYIKALPFISERVCGIACRLKDTDLFIYNIYMPCDTNNVDNYLAFNNVLSSLSVSLMLNKVKYCILRGDMNYDLSRRTESRNVTSLNH